MAIPSNPVIGTKYKFGTLRLNGAVKANPTLPWSIWKTPPGSSRGNMTRYTGTGTSISVGNSDADTANLIQWVYIGVINDRATYISDRCILTDMNRKQVENNGLVAGSTVTVDGTPCKVRMMTGGSQRRTNTSPSNGGTNPVANDWDLYVCNEAGIVGLPTPNTTDGTGTAEEKFNGAHNRFWNWFYMYTECKEIASYSGDGFRTCRGNSYASAWIDLSNTSSGSTLNDIIGYRPVLEVLNAAPAITAPPTDQSLGNKNAGFSQTYTISDADGDNMAVLITIDDTTLLDTTGFPSGGSGYVSVFNDVWDNLALGAHTIKITATDPQNASTTRTLTFTKVNTPPTAPLITGITAGQRIGLNGSISFNASTDADGDTLSYTLQFASDSAFTADLQTFTGAGSPISFSGLPINTTRYVRVVANDTKATTAGSTVLVKVGNKLEFTSTPINRPTMPVSARVMMDWSVAAGATYTLQVCNNANDAAPTWEDCTSEVDAGTAHTFTNASKTDASWAVGLRVVINAGTATGAIEVRAFGFDITVS